MDQNTFFNLKPFTPGYSPTLSSYLYLQAAVAQGCDVEYLEGSDYLILKKDGVEKTLRLDYCKMSFDFNAYSILMDKHQTKLFLERSKINTPRGCTVSETDKDKEILEKLKRLARPLVAKPFKGTDGGFGVFLGLTNDADLISKIRQIFEMGFELALVEEQFQGSEFRLLASNEKLLAATKRVPANVIGDGKSSIKELIETKNSDPNRGGHDYQKPLLKIEIDNDLICNLKDQNLGIESVPVKDQQIFLRKTSNLSTGGDSVDITDDVHPDIAKIAVSAIRAVPELLYAGIDIMTQDISKSPNECNYIILEMNTSPGIFMHHFPYQGKSRDVAKEIINLVFSETAKNGR